MQHTTSTTLPMQKNKRNFNTVTSRVTASPRRHHCGCRIPGQQERKVRRLRNSSGDHHRTAAVVTTARSPLLPLQQLRRYHRWNGHNTTGRSPLCSTSTKSHFTCKKLSTGTCNKVLVAKVLVAQPFPAGARAPCPGWPRPHVATGKQMQPLSRIKTRDGPRVRGIGPVEKEKVYGEKDLLKSQVLSSNERLIN